MKVEVSYEGMGTCIEATFSIDGERRFVLASCSSDTNDVTEDAVNTLMAYYAFLNTRAVLSKRRKRKQVRK